MNKRMLEFLQFQIHSLVAFLDRYVKEVGDDHAGYLLETRKHLSRAADDITTAIELRAERHD